MHNTPLHSPRGRRIIPARAGFTGPRSSRPAGTQDHPRSRGVYYDVVLIDCPPSGSSPLARGLLESFQHSQTVRRIIPARAGFTASRGPPRRRWPDHPRSRGVYGQSWATKTTVAGSSPLARGLHDSAHTGACQVGIIPARAGFTNSHAPTMSPSPDHPRSRGVYAYPTVYTHPLGGSSPLARGLHLRDDLPRSGGGIIPARAGFTPRERCAWLLLRDHPRSRGVYAPHQTGGEPPSGSSPLARGLHQLGLYCAPSWRIIPARAGFTPLSLSAHHPSPDHPRSRGVYCGVLGQDPELRGSSPLARGLHGERAGRNLPDRIIPARAGFTLADPWNPNDEPHYQTAFAFTADLALAPQSSDSAVVSQRLTRTPSEA